MIRRYNFRSRRVRCRLRTLSWFLRDRSIERVDLLKIDAERSEGRTLSGLTADDWGRIRQVVMEVHDGDDATRATLDLLRGHGFRAEAGENPAIPGLSIVYAIRL
ncbi:MAG: FkbM family methyltransferase [Gemmataceae bacterium]